MNVRRALDRPLLVDTAIAVLLAVLSLLALGVRARLERMPEPDVWAILLVLLINLPLAFRRRYPLWINLGVGALSAIYGASPYPDLVTPVPLGGVLALYTFVAWCDRRVAVALGVISGISVLAVAVVPSTNSDLVDFSFTALLLGSAWVLGDHARIRRAYTAELESRAALLSRERDLEARNAVAAERARIARDLHDVIAHHVSMMVVQAEAGPLTIERDPARAARAFDTIGTIGRQALVEMRRLLGVLRNENESPAAELRPQPGVQALPGLIERVRETGVEVSYAVEGDPVQLDAGADVSAYRIVQEALTNAMKHAEGAEVRVKLSYDKQDLRIDVQDNGRSTGAAVAVSPAGRGHGLTGMRERVQLFGGSLTAGPDAAGGFTVSAVLPAGSA